MATRARGEQEEREVAEEGTHDALPRNVDNEVNGNGESSEDDDEADPKAEIERILKEKAKKQLNVEEKAELQRGENPNLLLLNYLFSGKKKMGR
ncbi:hypothetical protein D8674_028086 [Pyrus ussuriensis x Pyrus communis]|uniref:Uncharacterized protein n=1 Tax=Pyrus ussuriensis x Pyrus communis TaxID=2448454 RepID=A0A5N5IGI0_9ROSA|nr:hypothetical protein D8674_028086 [Pyrus ussuriensis x Pyrus communis]